MALIDKASLLMVPSVYEDGTLYNVLPSGNKAPDETGNHNGYDQTRADFTFSRGSNLAATRVNSDGLIEKGRENLLTYSNTFTSWSNIGGTMTGGHEGYDGSNNAYKFTLSTGANICSQANTQSGVQTASVYAKGSVSNGLRIYAFGTSNCFAYFDLNIGAVETTNAVIDANIQDVGNGWYRCSVTFSQTNSNIYLYLSDNSNSNAVSGSIYIQDAQLEAGLVATDYIETGSSTAQAGILEDMPRINYDANGENGALLLESSRTNKLPYSEYIGSSEWLKTRLDVTTNTSDTKSPEGVYNAAKFVSNNASESYVNDFITISGTKATFSFFAKKGDLDFCHSLVWDNSQGGCRQWFDLVNGTTGTTTTFGASYSVDSASIEYAGNGWYRCITVFNVLAGTNGFRMNPSQADGNINSPVDAYGYFYGAQVEDGASYASSYIPTHGAAVTRGADDCDGAGNSDVFNDSEGTLFAEVFIEEDVESNVNISVSKGVHVQNLAKFIYLPSSDEFRFQIFGGATETSITTNNLSLGVYNKIAGSYDGSNIKLYINGVEIGTASTNQLPTGLNQFNFDRADGSAPFSGKCKQAIYFNEALSDSELADLTS